MIGEAGRLDRDAILQAAGFEATDANGFKVSLLEEVDSTNDAIRRLPRDHQHRAAILAEFQSLGRGRRGRRWHSPQNANIYLSLGWQFDPHVQQQASLPLVIGVATARALESLGLEGVTLKWPNDLLLKGQKLGGILVENHLGGSSSLAVIGIGINVDMGSDDGGAIDQPWTDLASHLASVDRNTVAGLVLRELAMVLPAWAEQGFVPFLDSWNRLDDLKGKTITVTTEGEEIHGVAMGIGPLGGLLIEAGGRQFEQVSGTVKKHGT